MRLERISQLGYRPLELMQAGIAAQQAGGLPALLAAADGASEIERGMALREVSSWVWCQTGFPSVELGHRLAAALMCTAPPDAVRPPWTCFLLCIPGGLIDATHALVMQTSASKWHVIVADNSRFAGQMGGTIPQLLGVDEGPETFLVDAYAHDEPSGSEASRAVGHNRRLLCSVTRLFANVCVAMANSSHVRAVGKGCSRAPFEGCTQPSAVPKSQLFRLGTPVQIDCREAVREYAAGRRRTPASVQWIVRGHWTRQAYGPGRSLRRQQWIEPYWKGPNGMPINVRPHVLGGST